MEKLSLSKVTFNLVENTILEFNTKESPSSMKSKKIHQAQDTQSKSILKKRKRPQDVEKFCLSIAALPLDVQKRRIHTLVNGLEKQDKAELTVKIAKRLKQLQFLQRQDSKLDLHIPHDFDQTLEACIVYLNVKRLSDFRVICYSDSCILMLLETAMVLSNLDEVDPARSTCLVLPDKVILTLAKVVHQESSKRPLLTHSKLEPYTYGKFLNCKNMCAFSTPTPVDIGAELDEQELNNSRAADIERSLENLLEPEPQAQGCPALTEFSDGEDNIPPYKGYKGYRGVRIEDARSLLGEEDDLDPQEARDGKASCTSSQIETITTSIDGQVENDNDQTEAFSEPDMDCMQIDTALTASQSHKRSNSAPPAFPSLYPTVLSPAYQHSLNMALVRDCRSAGPEGIPNYSEKLSQMVYDRHATKCGLYNEGIDCYINTVIQCLASVPEFVDYFLDKKYMNHINTKNPISNSKGNMAHAYASLLDKLFTSVQPVTITEFKRALEQYWGLYDQFQQQDAQEFLNYLLDALHEDVNKIVDKPYVELPDFEDSVPDEKVAGVFWDAHTKRNDSIVVDLFQGQYKSLTKCQECGNTSIKFDPFMNLSMDIPQSVDIPLKFYMVTYNFEKCLLQWNISTKTTFADLRERILEDIGEVQFSVSCIT